MSGSTVRYHLQQMRQLGTIVETRGRRSDRCPHCGQ